MITLLGFGLHALLSMIGGMLLLRPRGRTADGERQVYEHVRTHQMYEIPVGTLDAEFFVKIQGQLDVLVGPSKTPAEPAPATSAVPPPAGAAWALTLAVLMIPACVARIASTVAAGEMPTRAMARPSG